MDIDVRDNIKSVQKQLNRLGQEKIFPKAANQAINKTAMKGKTQLKRGLKEELNTKNMKSINSRLKLWRSNWRTLHAEIKLKDKFLNLFSFKGAKQNRVGVVANVGRRNHTHKGAFLAKSPQGQKLAWYRKGKKRLPISTAVGMGLSQGYEKLKPGLDKFINTEVVVQMQRSINFHLERSLRKK